MSEVKRPRHIQIAINHIVKQRDRAEAVRIKAAEEVAQLEKSLAELGWYPEFTLFNLPAADPAKAK